MRTDCVDVRLCNLTVHTGLSADSILGTFGGSKVTVVCATAWLSVETSSVDITAKSHLQSKSSLEEEFWDATSEIYTDIAKNDSQRGWKATARQTDFWLRFLPVFSKVTEQLIGDHSDRNYG